MKRYIILFVILIMVTSVSACSQNEFSTATSKSDSKTETEQVDSSQVPISNVENPLTNQKTGKMVLVFDTSITDSQDMSPAYVDGVCKILAVFEKDDGGYTGDIEIIRKFTQGYEERNPKNQGDGYMMISYISKIDDNKEEVIPAEAKAALEELAKGDNGQKFYGIFSTASHLEQYKIESTFDFYIPFDYKKSNNDVLDIPYILSVNGDNAKLYLYLHELSVFQVEGKINNLPAASPIMANLDADLLHINDKGFSVEAEKLQDIWHMMFLGKKDGNSYNGHLYLSRMEQKYSSYGSPLYFTGNSDQYEDDIELNLQPFDEDSYRKAGGQMGSMHIASLSHMATLNCQGINVLFTAAGDKVYAELPESSFQGLFEGKFTAEDEEKEQIYEEDLELCYAEFEYSSSPKIEGIEGFEKSLFQGIEMAGVTLTEEQLDMIMEAGSTAGYIDAQSLWLPQEFLPMTAPIDFMEQNVMFNPTFSYGEDNLWLDTISPIYRQRFEGMKGFSTQEGEIGGHWCMEIVFRYGSKSFYIQSYDANSGASIRVMMFGQ